MTASNFAQFEESLRRCVRQLRTESGTTQTQFAKRGSSLRQSTIAKFESGYSPNVTLRTVYEIAQACLIPLSELIGLAEGEKRKNAKEDTLTMAIREAAGLSPEKRKLLAEVVRAFLRSDR